MQQDMNGLSDRSSVSDADSEYYSGSSPQGITDWHGADTPGGVTDGCLSADVGSGSMLVIRNQTQAERDAKRAWLAAIKAEAKGDLTFNPPMDQLVELGLLNRKQADEYLHVAAECGVYGSDCLNDFYDEGLPPWHMALLLLAIDDLNIMKLLQEACEIAEHSLTHRPYRGSSYPF